MTSFVISLLIGLFLLNIWMYFQQPQMIFFPIRNLHQKPTDWGLDYEDITFNTVDNVELHGWYIPHNHSNQVVLFFHGNAGNISHRRDSIEIFHRLGLNIFIIDYRGYGQSKGRPDEQGLNHDAMAAWDFLTMKKGFTSKQILIFGRSLGGAVAVNLASKVQARGLMLESTFSSAPEFSRTVFPILSRLVFMRFKFNSAENIRHVQFPVLVLHSPEDEIMPFHLGEQLFNSANQPKRFVSMRGDHNNGFLHSQPVYEQELNSFLKSL